MRASGRSPLASALAVMALVAMLGATALLAADPAVAGLQPGHGHVTADGAPPPAHDHAPGSDEADEGGIVFSFARDGSVAAAVVVPGPAAITPAPVASPDRPALAEATPEEVVLAPGTDPPRA